MKLSIIIPVYNASQYIEECIASLLCQTIDDFEIIIIDDKGKDDSIDKIKNIQNTHLKGELIRIFTMPENSGAWAARNKGIELSTGEYIGFVDADDWCDFDMFNVLYKNAIKHDADWSFTGAVKELKYGLSVPIEQTKINSGFFCNDNKRKFTTRNKALFWTGIYKRAFILKHSILFPKSKFSEDSYFVWMVVFLAKNVAVDNNYFYHYRTVESSVSRLPDNTKAMQKVKIFKRLIDDLKNKGIYDKYSQEIDYLCIKKGYIIPILIICINHHKDCKKQIVEINEYLEDFLTNALNNKYLKKDIYCKLLIKMIVNYPRFLSFLLRLKYKQDPF